MAGKAVTLTRQEIDALRAACRFALDEDPPIMWTRGPLINAIRRAFRKLESAALARAEGE